MHHARKVEELSPLIHLSPKPLFQILLCSLQSFCILESVEVCENAHHSRKSMNLTNIEELEDLHLKTKAGVDEEKNKVGYLGHVDHAVDVIGALDEGQPPLFPRHHRDRTLDGGQVLPREVLDQPLQESGLANFRRTHNRDHYWWGFHRSSVHSGLVSPFLTDVPFSSHPPFCLSDILHCKGLWVPLPCSQFLKNYGW